MSQRAKKDEFSFVLMVPLDQVLDLLISVETVM
jgi:hypothetical protein